MVNRQSSVRVEYWRGGQHPTFSTITRLMQEQGMRPYMWTNSANYRHAVCSHGYDKVLYVVEGVLEFTLPDSNQRVNLRAGDRIEIPTGTRYGIIVGSSGVKCVEASISRRRQRSGKKTR